MLRIIVLLLLISSSAVGQAVKFYATTDGHQFVAGQYFKVSFVLENARGSAFRAPSFIEFETLSGPNTSSQMSIANGKASQKQSYSYTLSADEPGKYIIESASINVGGKTYHTQPIEVEAVRGQDVVSSNGEQIDESVFVRTELSATDAFIGQQLTLKFVLFTTKDVRSYNFISLPDFDGFFAHEIQSYNERPKRVVENGIQYTTKVLKVISLFPQQKGTFAIDEAVINIGVSTGNSRGSFFFNTNLKPVRLKTEALEIQVGDLPGKAPISFNGAVGKFQMGASVDKKTLAMDDALTLTLQIRGDGDNKFIEAPKQPFSDLFDIYDPNLLREETVPRGDRIELTKTYEYLLIPKKTGVLHFTPELSYFHPDSGSYITLTAQEFSAQVIAASANHDEVFAVEERELPPVFTTTRLMKKGEFFLYSKPYWAANGALLLSLFGFIIVKRVQLHSAGIDPSIKRNNKARKLAMQRLSDAKSKLDKNQITEFYIHLRKGILDYLSDKTNQSSSNLTKDSIRQILEQRDLEVYIDDMIRLLEKGEMAIYASIPPGNDRESYSIAVELIENIETSLKK